MGDFADLMRRIEGGDRAAVNEFLPIVYDELRRLARRHLAREKPGLTLQTTALVHEAYVKLFGTTPSHWSDQRHFYLAASEAMRRILVDAARRRAAKKRGGAQELAPEEPADPTAAAHGPHRSELLDLDEALGRLERVAPDAAELVKLRYFSGLSVAEAASVLEVSERTCNRNWLFAKAWLARELSR